MSSKVDFFRVAKTLTFKTRLKAWFPYDHYDRSDRKVVSI